MCVYQESDGDPDSCPVWVLGQCYLHLCKHGATKKAILLAYYPGGKWFDVNANHISAALKLTARALEYPILKGIPIECINTHSLISGGANVLAHAGYSNTQIQKMGRWLGATFKEYVWNELACFSKGMFCDMKKKSALSMCLTMHLVTSQTHVSTRTMWVNYQWWWSKLLAWI